MTRNRIHITGVAVEERPRSFRFAPRSWVCYFTVAHRLAGGDVIWVPIRASGDLTRKVWRRYIEWGEVRVVGSIGVDSKDDLFVHAHHIAFVGRARFRRDALLWRGLGVEYVNEFALSGVVEDDPFFRGGERPMAAMTVKVPYGDGRANYIRVVAFGDLAANVHNTVAAGTSVSVRGRLSSYRQDGKTLVSAVANSVEVVGAGKQDEELPF